MSRGVCVRVVRSVLFLFALVFSGRVSGQAAVDTLDLPFFDDFSGPLVVPFEEYWEKRNDVACGAQVAIAPPTVGAAIFDALRGDGTFHAEHGAVGNACDTLTSRPIRLVGGDSVYLSFQFQPQGWGGQPQPSDVLAVDFYDPLAKEWREVWRVSYEANAHRLVQHYSYPEGKERDKMVTGVDLSRRFTKVHLPVVPPYYARGFQFRFRNMVGLLKDTQMPGRQANTGHWAVDVVYLDRGRTSGDTIYLNDEACVSHLAGIDLPYMSIPYVLATSWLQQLDRNPNKMIGMRYVNLDRRTRAVGREYSIEDATGTLPQARSSHATFENLDPRMEMEYLRTYTYGFSQLAGREVDVMLKANLKVVTSAPVSAFYWNDTVRRRLHFADAYAYDTGIPDNGYGVEGLSAARASVAMRFEPIAAGTIQRVRIYFNPIVDPSSRSRFDIVVWNERGGMPGDELYAQRCSPPEAFDVDAPFAEYTLERPIGFSEPLYVGWRQTKADMMQVGIDLHTPTPSKIVYNAMGAWAESQYEGALMIRLVCTAGGQTPIFTGVREEEEVKLEIFPNPGRDRVAVVGVPSGSVVELVSVAGQLVRSVRAGEARVVVPVHDLAEGIYLVVVRGAAGAVLASERLVVL